METNQKSYYNMNKGLVILSMKAMQKTINILIILLLLLKLLFCLSFVLIIMHLPEK